MWQDGGMWFLLQIAVIAGVGGSVLALGLTTNGLLAGIIGFGVAKGATVAIVRVVAWVSAARARRPMRPAPGTHAGRHEELTAGRQRSLR